MRWAILACVAGIGFLADPAFAAGSALEPAAEGPTRTLRDWYAMGGPTMHALFVCSVVGLALILERSAALRRRRFVPRDLTRELEATIAAGHRQEIKRLCEHGDSALASLCRIALLGPDARDHLQSEGSAFAHRAQRNLPLLAAVGNLATMLGLLGTVLGMVDAFDVIARSGTGDARIVAGGIFRALITTAAGLGIGVIALAAHALFSRRASDLIVGLESLVTRVSELVGHPNPAWTGPPELENEAD